MNDQSQKKSSASVRIVIMEPGGPVNAASIARAMANFGFNDLVIVSQSDIIDDGRGARIAMGGSDVYRSRRIAASLDEAIEGCAIVIGTTRRSRSDETCIDFREAAVIAAARSRTETVALLLGRERDGLSREERSRCHILAEIPSIDGPAGSLNISHAASLILCGIYCELAEKKTGPTADPSGISDAFDDLFIKCGIHEKNGKAQIILRGLLERASVTADEAKLLESSLRLFGSKIKAE